MLQAQIMTANDQTRVQLQQMQAGWLTMHGLIKADGNDIAGAIELHTKAIGLDPGVPAAWMNRCVCMSVTGPRFWGACFPGTGRFLSAV
jgi:hypothetical protein